MKPATLRGCGSIPFRTSRELPVNPMPRRIESHLLDGPAGKLEALLETPEEAAPRAAALVCHPHPLFGGTMHNKVVHRVARALRSSGYVVLRFNFRGAGKSEGRHDLGVGEIEDARAALGWLRQRYPGLPYTLAGFSFGSRVILNLGCALPDVERLIALGFPPSATLWACWLIAPPPRSSFRAPTTSTGRRRRWRPSTRKWRSPSG